MAKLYFRYGTMDSAKSMNMLAVAHNYRKQGKKVLLVKPRLDTRFGAPTWRDADGYGKTWATRTAEIGLFVAGKGGWVVETHELRPAVASAAPGAT